MVGDKREALLAAAERAILADGFAGASTRRIAQEADVPLSLLHYYFGGKEGLLVALVERARDRNRTAVQERLSGPGPARARAAAALATARETFLGGDSVRLLLELAVAALHNPRLHAEVERLYREAMQALGASARDLLKESGHAGPGEIRPEAVASLVLAAGIGLALQQMLGVDRRATEEAFDTLGSLLLDRLAGHAAVATGEE
jgi:AcrR family transcriptional regulator